MSTQTKQQAVEEILRGITIPSPPQIIVDLQIEMASPDPDLNAMAKLIANDAGLAGSILKTANSPFYQTHGHVDSISKAVMFLGMNVVMNIVNTVCLRNAALLGGQLSDEMLNAMSRFWDSATDVAHAAVLVAQKLGIAPHDHVYSLGLFHNTGIPLMMLKHPDYPQIMAQAYAEPGRRLIDIENRHYNTNHAVLGFFVARSWKLPKSLCEIIGRHHNTDIFSTQDGTEPETKQLLAILKTAEHLAGLHTVLGDQQENQEWQSHGEDVLAVAGLSPYDYEDVVQQAQELGLGGQQYFF
jgi:HD-like signal output (HDOD) protein